MLSNKTEPKTGKLARYIAGTLMVAAGFIMTGCNESSNDSPADESTFLQMGIPDSLTGGKVAGQTVHTGRTIASAVSRKNADVPCAWVGPDDDDDIFRNGYEMTKFMVSAVATWTCITDNLIELSDTVVHNGEITETENDFDAVDYDAEEPTHYSVTDESETQTTIRLYYAYSRVTPPTAEMDAEFYFSWDETQEDIYTGRLIIDMTGLNRTTHKIDDPVMMRMDFGRTATEQSADMVLRFDENNEWAEGFRISLTKDLAAQSNEQTFIARGIMDMKRQFFVDTEISELPILQMYTVSDKFGNGAAVADFVDVALPLVIIPATETEVGNHLGNYLFTKNDLYVFDENGDWEWIEKTFTTAEYRGGRTTPATGGTIDPLNPSLEGIAMYLNLNSSGQTYFEGNACNISGDDCTALLNAIYDDGFADEEGNQGTDPGDWRSMAVLAVESSDYLASVYPNGMDWTGAFDMVYTP